MTTVKFPIKRLLWYSVLIFIGSFIWHLLRGYEGYAAVKEAFAVFLIGLLAMSIMEAAFRYYEK